MPVEARRSYREGLVVLSCMHVLSVFLVLTTSDAG